MYGFVLVCIRIVLMKEQYIYKCQSKIFILHICAKIENLLNRCAANDKQLKEIHIKTAKKYGELIGGN